MNFEFMGNVTAVLIVGSQHIGPGVSDAMLENTFSRFVAWKPDVVGIEILSSEVVALYHEQGGWLSDLKYGGFPQALRLGQAAQAFTGWTRSEAMHQASEAVETRTRVLAFLAAFEPFNALLHWTPDMDLPSDLHEGLSELNASGWECVRLGVNVARQLGHERLALLDYFPMPEMRRDWWAQYEAGCDTPEFKAWLAPHPCVVNGNWASEQARASGDYWDVLRHLNSTEGVRDNVNLENEANFRLGIPGRAKQADWDARNLFMAALLRQETARIPGGKLLFVVGGSHKGPIEAALRALGPDVRIVDFSELDG